jgi:IclR family KDG regulon transcriptional repressor
LRGNPGQSSFASSCFDSFGEIASQCTRIGEKGTDAFDNNRIAWGEKGFSVFMKDHARKQYSISALRRGLKLLSLVGESQKALSAGEIARLANLHTSTVHRFLVNLESAGFLVREDSTRKYQLGPACISLGRAALGRLDIHHVSLPYLQELNRMTRETIHLTVRQDLTAIYVGKLESPEPLRIFSEVGRAIPLHCTAVGKVFLAHLSPEEWDDVAPRLVLRRFTSNTITSLQQLQAQLNRVRQHGYAVDMEENESHIRCIAGPIMDHRGKVKAAFSVTGPASRMTKARLRELAAVVTKWSRDMSEQLGYKPSSQAEKSTGSHAGARRALIAQAE